MEKKQWRVGPYLEWTCLVVLVVGIIGLSVSLIRGQTQKNFVQSEDQMETETTVVLYDGPKSLRMATEEDLAITAENLRDFSLLKSSDTLVTVNGEDCFVYETNVNHTRSWVANYLPPIARTPVTYFDFEGRVTIEVTVPNQALDSVVIRPLAYNIQPEINQETHQVSFTIDQADAYTIEFDGSPARALHLFANGLEKDLPDFEDESVIYIGPGEWDVDTITLKSGQTLYIAGGAVVHGIVQSNFCKDMKVMGRGIIDGSAYETWKGKSAYVPLKFDYCDQVVIEDIMVLNSNAWVCQAYASTNGLIDNLKIISPRPNGDGITLQSCENYEVRGGFIRTWDDSLVVKNYGQTSSKNILFSGIQLWTDLAQSMEVGYETNKGQYEDMSIDNVTFQDITVLNNFHKPVISIHNGDDADIHHINFQDIVVENARMGSGDGSVMPYLIDLHIGYSSNWSSTKERGTIHDIWIENVQVLGGESHRSRIEGFDEDHRIERVTIKNLVELGVEVTDFSSFEVDEPSTKDLVIE